MKRRYAVVELGSGGLGRFHVGQVGSRKDVTDVRVYALEMRKVPRHLPKERTLGYVEGRCFTSYVPRGYRKGARRELRGWLGGKQTDALPQKVALYAQTVCLRIVSRHSSIHVAVAVCKLLTAQWKAEHGGWDPYLTVPTGPVGAVAVATRLQVPAYR